VGNAASGAAKKAAGFGRKAATAAVDGASSASKSFLDGLSAMRDVHNASKELGAARAHLDEIEADIRENAKELEHRQDITSRYDQIVAEQTSALEAAQQEHADIEAKIEQLGREHDELEAKLAQMKKDHEQELKPYRDLMDAARSRADEAARGLAEARRSVKNAETQVADLTSRRDARLSNANHTIDSARARLNDLQSSLDKLRADPSSKPEAIEEVTAAIMTETNHLTAAQKEVDDVTSEMQRATENAQAHLWTQKQSLESAERANEAAKAEDQKRHEDFDKMRQDASTKEAVLDNAVVEREMGTRDARKELDAAQKRIDEAQAALDEANDIHAHPEVMDELKAAIADDQAAREVQQRQVDELTKAGQALRERTRTERTVFIGIVAVAAVVVIVLLWLFVF
jgi:DNA repair exonuclease SbcCD ATPase subunit